MRQSREAKAQSHAAIVSQAARLFRERGIDQTSVADVMQAANLTHGGFYRHFQSKDELLAAALEAAFNDMMYVFEKKTPSETPRAAVNRYASRYLSDGHLNSPGIGCPVAALGVEVGRSGGLAVATSAQGIERMVDAVSQRLSGSKHAARKRAMHMLATMVGAIVMARATGGTAVGKEVLAVCREQLSS